MTTKLRRVTLHQIAVAKDAGHLSHHFSRRLRSYHRAKKLARYLTRRLGLYAYTTPLHVTLTRAEAERMGWR